MKRKSFPKEMKIPFYDALDRDSVRGVRRALRLLETFGFESKSSPLVVLLDSGIDFSLTAVEEIRKENLQLRRQDINPSLQFSEKYTDPLGNPLQTKSYKPAKAYQPRKNLDDPAAESFFIALAEFFVRLKKGDPIQDSFMESFSNFLPSPRRGGTAKIKADTATTAHSAVAAYHRRQRNRRQKFKTNRI